MTECVSSLDGQQVRSKTRLERASSQATTRLFSLKMWRNSHDGESLFDFTDHESPHQHKTRAAKATDLLPSRRIEATFPTGESR